MIFIQLDSDQLSLLIQGAVLQALSAQVPDKQTTPPPAEKETTFDIAGLADYLSCSKQTIFNLKKEGTIPFYRLGRKIFFKKIEIDANARVAAIGENKKGGKL